MLLLKQKKKKSNYLFIIIGVILGVLFCFFNSYINRFKDQKINLIITDTLDLFTYSIFEYSVAGKEKLEYTPTLFYNNFELKIGKRFISNDKTKGFYFTDRTEFVKDDSLLVEFVFDILKDNNINLKLTMNSYEPRVTIDTVFTVYIKIPPISVINNVTGTNIKESDFQISKWENEIRKHYPNEKEKLIKRCAILCELLRRNYIRSIMSDYPLVRFTYDGIDFGGREDELKKIRELPVLINGTKNISISLRVDTIYDLTYIMQYYSGINNFLFQSLSLWASDSLDKIIRGSNHFERLRMKNVKIEKLGNGYILTKEIKPIFGNTLSGNGPMGIYLVNVDASGSYFIQEVANYIVDKTPPYFFQTTTFGELGADERFNGCLSLDAKDFEGYNPYNVPFIGMAHGDIKEIFVDGMKVPFKIGHEFYFKKKVYLDGGYNRIPVKIIDYAGNVGEYYVVTTIGSIKDNE